MVNREKYYNTVKEFCKKYGEKPSSHILDIITDVVMRRDNVWFGGNFVEAVVDNNLQKVVDYGDKECLLNIKLIVSAKLYCHIK